MSLEILVGGTGNSNVQPGDAGSMAGVIMDGRNDLKSSGGCVYAYKVGRHPGIC